MLPFPRVLGGACGEASPGAWTARVWNLWIASFLLTKNLARGVLVVKPGPVFVSSPSVQANQSTEIEGALLRGYRG